MILGVDIGNYSTKTSELSIFDSKVSIIGNILENNMKIELNREICYLGDGNFDTCYRKVEKESYIKLLFGALALSTKERMIDLVLGLPLSQFNSDKDLLKERIMDDRYLIGKFNNEHKEYVIRNIEVYPEGLGGIDNNYEGIILDIGGLTTDIALLEIKNNKRKIINPLSLNQGTLHLYSNFIKVINSKYSLDLTSNDTERILRNGLKINGETKNITFAMDVFKEFTEGIIRQLNVEYSLSTNNLAMLGGGGIILAKSIIKRVPQAFLVDEPLFANANNFKKRGVSLWE
ncbi:MAG: ParM/StbA family protein [Clostridium sp.]|uniref:ParM/StbA family protein n=1 Tax=Clostridium sp. TaxID=1506 RepID=UPI00306652E1